MQRLKLAVLLSGSGTTLENIFQKSAAGTLHADVALVVASRSDAFGVERAKRRGVSARVVEKKQFKNTAEFSQALFDVITPYSPDLIVLAGFMSLLKIPPQYKNKVINVHPALLPAFGGKGFYGRHVHEAVLKHGCKLAGCTVHFVDDAYDQGPIIAQKAVPVLPDDTADSLAARVQLAEREIYPEVIELIAQDRLRIENGRVCVTPG